MLRKAKIVATSILIVILSIITMETFFWFSEISLPSYYQLDDEMGIDYRPNSKVLVLNEGFYLGRINEGGYIGKYYPKEKSEGSYRIALCGDSYTEAFQLFEKFHFGNILKRKLNERINKQIEVLNFGKSGIDFRTMFINYLLKIEDYNPDLMIFVVSTSRFEKQISQSGPKLVCRNDSLIIENGFSKRSDYQLKNELSFLRKLSTFSLLQNANTLYQSDKTLGIIFGKFYTNLTQQNEIKYVVEVTPNAYDPFFETNKKIIETIRSINISGKPDFMLVSIDALPNHYQSLIDENNIKLFEAEALLETLREEGIKTNYWKATNKYGHWNHVAHKHIGMYLSEFIWEYFFDEIQYAKAL